MHVQIINEELTLLIVIYISLTNTKKQVFCLLNVLLTQIFTSLDVKHQESFFNKVMRNDEDKINKLKKVINMFIKKSKQIVFQHLSIYIINESKFNIIVFM